ncbi:MAG: ABC transporter permease subunit [Oscillospiraceae bacterium]|jgi:sodium transport system permease protein|nr:ABC transporter permease subunit [Oscillospiraceae bacterium]
MMKMIKQMVVVLVKELKCIIRDKKTFIFGIVLPFLWVPVMLLIIDFSMKSSQSQISDNVNIGISSKDNSFYTFCSAQKNITIIDVNDPKSSKIAAYVTLDADIDSKILGGEDFNLNVDYNDSSINSMMSIPIVSYYEGIYRSIINDYRSRFKNKEGLNKFVAIEIPYTLDEQVPNINTSSLYFNMLVPMMLILYCCIGSASTANDLSAGEKERGTLESLLSTGADRTGIIIGKLLATTAMGATSGLCTVLGLCGYLLISSGSQKIHLSVLEMVSLLVIILFTSMFFASVNLAVGVYSRSYKEAQTYLTPMSIICLIPAYFTYTLDASGIGIGYLCVPVLNIICIIKEIFANAVNIYHVSIVVFWLILYVLSAFYITNNMFKKESVVFRI